MCYECFVNRIVVIWEAALHDVGSVDFVLLREILTGGFVFAMCVRYVFGTSLRNVSRERS